MVGENFQVEWGEVYGRGQLSCGVGKTFRLGGRELAGREGSGGSGELSSRTKG